MQPGPPGSRSKRRSGKRAVMEDVLDYTLEHGGQIGRDIYVFNNEIVKERSLKRKFSNQFDASKFDASAKLPTRLRKDGFYILHLGTRDGESGNHAFVRGGEPKPGRDYPGYHTFEKGIPSQEITVPKDILSRLGTSEAQIASNLYNYRIIHDYLGLNKSDKVYIGISRRTSVSYDAFVPTKNGHEIINVSDVQIETDTLFEFDNLIVHVEIKNSKNEDFSIYQLFSPRKYLQENLEQPPGGTLDNLEQLKPIIRSLYLVGLPAKNTYSLYEYEFSDLNKLDSIKFKAGKEYHVRYE